MIFGNYQPRVGNQQARVKSAKTQSAVPRHESPRSAKLPFETLGNVLGALQILAIFAGVIAIAAAFAGEAGAWAAAGVFFGAAISCALGRVLTYIAERADYVAKLLERANRASEKDF